MRNLETQSVKFPIDIEKSPHKHWFEKCAAYTIPNNLPPKPSLTANSSVPDQPDEDIQKILRACDRRILSIMEFGFRITAIPQPVFAFKNLEYLWLAGNHISAISPEISALQNLTSLNLSWNRLSGLCNELFTLPNLLWLALDSNPGLNLSGPDVFQLTNLRVLSIGGTATTRIHPNISKLVNLSDLIFPGANCVRYLPNFANCQT